MASHGGMQDQEKSDKKNRKSAGGKPAGDRRETASDGSKRGGTHEQHVKAGRQSHKNDH